MQLSCFTVALKVDLQQCTKQQTGYVKHTVSNWKINFSPTPLTLSSKDENLQLSTLWVVCY